MLDPEYVSPGDEFGDESWKYPNSDLEKRILAAAGRKYYGKPTQAKKVRAIVARTAGDVPKYPTAYLEEVLAWCLKMNKTRTVITIDALITAIRNPDNYARWANRKPKTEERDDYSGDFSW